MAAIAAIPNPIVSDSSNSQETLLFYLTSDNQCALQKRLPGKGDPLDTPKLPTGCLINPSTFGVAQYDNLVAVYGMSDGGKDSSSNQIFVPSLVSPVLRPLGQQTDLSSLAVCSDGGSQGWLYYLKGSTDPAIQEIVLDGLSASGYTDNSPLSTSYLAACYDSYTKARFCFYQDDDHIHYLDPDDQSTESVSNTEDCRDDNAPMAVCVIPAASNPNGETNICLYYANSKHELQRVTYNGSTWTKSSTTKMQKAPKVADWTQMTVVPDVGAKVNRLFYVQKGKDAQGFATWSDPFVQ